jgi:hypothetical protein
MKEDIEAAFVRFVEDKRRDALNVAAPEFTRTMKKPPSY